MGQHPQNSAALRATASPTWSRDRGPRLGASWLSFSLASAYATRVSGLPARYALPDLSALDDRLVANPVLSLTIGRGFPPSDAQPLVTAFVRTTEGALRRYEEARSALERSAQQRSLVDYLRGIDAMELTIMALHRVMRVAEALVRSGETRVGNAELPVAADRDRRRRMRNAVDHRDEPIIAGRPATGRRLLSAYVRTT